MIKILSFHILFLLLFSCNKQDQVIHIYLRDGQTGWGAILFEDGLSKNSDRILVNKDLIGTTSLTFQPKVMDDSQVYFRFHRIKDNDTIDLELTSDKCEDCVNSLTLSRLTTSEDLNKTYTFVQFHVGIDTLTDTDRDFIQFEKRIDEWVRQR